MIGVPPGKQCLSIEPRAAQLTERSKGHCFLVRWLTVLLVLLLAVAPVCAEEKPSSSDKDSERNETASFRLARETLLAVLAKKQLEQDLNGFLDRFNEQEEIIGERRRRELQVALFHLQREEFGLSLQDDPIALEQSADIVKGCVSKILREELEDRMKLDLALGRLDRHRERLVAKASSRVRPNAASDSEEMSLGEVSQAQSSDEPVADERMRLSISPRLNGGSDSDVGAKLRLYGTDSILNRFTLRFEQGVDKDRHAVSLEYRDGRWNVFLHHSYNDLRAGHSVGFFARYHFSSRSPF